MLFRSRVSTILVNSGSSHFISDWVDVHILCLMQVDGMDFLAVKQACKFAKEHVLENGPIVSIQKKHCCLLAYFSLLC